ncbi:MAG TPA: FGGY-family carbohydrate kinase [Acidimicrobiales bacterium]|nr:FGGY-family carbohydrate kinase [Acidimicrobiales bacterium]
MTADGPGGGGVLVVDVGTSGVRAAVVRPDGTVAHVHHRAVLPSSPAPGLVEVDAAAIAGAALETAAAAVADGGPVGGVGIANQRATTVVWDRATGVPVGPGLGWQDLRTVMTCLALQSEGLRLAPNMSATKLAAILDDVDPDRSRAAAGELCFGTVDSWVAWTLSGGAGAGGGGSGGGGGTAGGGGGTGEAVHVTDATNAAVTGLVRLGDGGWEWDRKVLEALRIPEAVLPAIVDSSGAVGWATALAGGPPICGMAGDQQASLVGQGCTRPGLAKATFGTGGMLDLCTGPATPSTLGRGPAGTFPIVGWQRAGEPTWGVEAIMLSAGTCVEWLRDDLGVLETAAQSAAVAAACADTGDVWFVPALLGMGTPVWDFGARGTLLGITRGTGRPELVRAVLEGVAHRGADLLEAAEADSGFTVDALRVDGGMAANEVFVSALAEAVGRPVLVSRELEATTLGAGMLAGLAVGIWKDEDDVAAAYRPHRTVEPAGTDDERAGRRERWLAARERAVGTIPELSGIAF